VATSTSAEQDTVEFALGTTVVGAIVGAVAGGMGGYQLGAAMLEPPETSADHPLDDLVVNAFEAFGGLLLVGAVTILVLCVGVVLGTYIALRLTKRQRAGATLLWCGVLQFGGVPLGFIVANAVDGFAEDLAVIAGLAVVVLLVPLVARFIAVRYGPTTV